MRAAALTILALLSVAACASTERQRAARLANPAPCPNIFVLDLASRFVEFGGEDPSLEAVKFSGEIDDVQTSCRYYADVPIRADVDLALSVGRADASAAETINIPFFVAVMRTNRDVIEKEVFEVPVTFRAGERVVSLERSIDEIVIPRRGENTSGTNFEISIGFQLTEAQYRFNRSGKSLKFPES
ncbi:hypothetical protein [Parvularcula maris]|uniref:Uncharacterized protein n=1 Tax=Parvularcula maris TaxID=2965077 RepID=A0A9X2LB04_9PROT|nr:hypothetical protein [Parvularcula maris]MCQ8186380.1 hypothetical protein [Parvularcula maris]